MPLGRRTLLLLIALGAGGCAAVPSATSQTALDLSLSSSEARLPETVLDTESLDELNVHFAALQRDSGWRLRGYLTPDEHDRLEQLYAAYLRRRQFLMAAAANAVENAEQAFEGPDFVGLAHRLRAEQIDGDSLLVEIFANDRVAVRKMNEAFHRSDIPHGTFDQLRLAVTHPGTLTYLQQVAETAEDVEETESAMRFVSHAGDRVAPATPSPSPAQRCLRAQRRVRRLLEQQYPVAPELVNNVRHLRAAEGVVRSGREIQSALSSARSWTVARVGRIQNPTCQPLQLTASQKQQICQALQPGDVLLTYRAGLASNLFLPGRFKHAIIYIGTVEDRRRMGIANDPSHSQPGLDPQELAATASRHEARGDDTESMRRGDVVESLAEGVVFNHLADILEERINLMVVFRPVLRADERRAALHSVLSFVGDAYDFRFDFADASDQVCTELFYRSYNGKSEIRLPLTRRFGRETLNADDIIYDYLAAPSRGFQLVLLVAPDASPREHLARVFFGPSAHEPLAMLMER